MTWAVYKHTCLKNHLVYIGITMLNPPDKRWLNGLGYKENHLFYYDIEKYGWERGFTHEILISGIPTKEEALKLEDEIITKYYLDEDYRASIKGNYFGLILYNRNIRERDRQREALERVKKLHPELVQEQKKKRKYKKRKKKNKK